MRTATAALLSLLLSVSRDNHVTVVRGESGVESALQLSRWPVQLYSCNLYALYSHQSVSYTMYRLHTAVYAETLLKRSQKVREKLAAARSMSRTHPKE